LQFLRKILGRKLLVTKQSEVRMAVPEGEIVVAIGDIHGMLPELHGLEKNIEAKLAAIGAETTIKRSTYVFLGDYIDRGNASASVLDHLIASTRNANASARLVFLRGNHEQLLLDFLEQDNAESPMWLRNGGFETLESYGVFLNRKPSALQISAAREELLRNLPETNLQFLQNTQLSHVAGDYFFCHASVDVNVPLENQVAKNLLWSRNTKFLDTHFIEKCIVHGHTPVKTPQIGRGHINIDTGAYATGTLTALILFGTEKYFVTNKS
jgi:serine/threonine protein phosphatase 1